MCGANFWKNIISKIYIKTQKVTNATNLISQSEPSSPKEILADNKIHTGPYFFSEGTGYSVTP